MSLRRILKMLVAFFMGQGVSIVSQLLIPPFFLHRYAQGIEVYGEWIALSAAVTYLNTLNYGIQTYATNESTICYNRGDREEARRIQSSAALLLCTVVVGFSILGLSIFKMPIGHWLNLRHVSSQAASLTLYLLLLQILTNMILSLTCNSFMVMGMAHRGSYWGQAQRLISILALAAGVWFRASFPWLALTQLASIVLFSVFVLVDIARNTPFLLPAPKYAHWRTAISLLKPSGHFGLLSLSGFFAWQGPVLVLQKVLGPTSVAVFSLARVIFAMGRQALAILSFSIGQEITHLVGQRNWPQLKKLYDLSEKVVLLMVPLFSAGLLLLSPLLFSVWLHKRSLYDPSLCFMMALISAVMGIKEHKYQFQSASNRHEELSKFTITAYFLMLAVSALLLKPFGIFAFMLCWLIVEIVQTIYIVHLNTQLFPREFEISWKPLIRLAVMLGFCFTLSAWPAFHAANWPLVKVSSVAIAAIAAMLVIAYYAFGLQDVRSVLEARFRKRAPAWG